MKRFVAFFSLFLIGDAQAVEVCVKMSNGKWMCKSSEPTLPPYQDYAAPSDQNYKTHPHIFQQVDQKSSVPSSLAPGAMGPQGPSLAHSIVDAATTLSSISGSMARADQERAMRYQSIGAPTGLSAAQKSEAYAQFLRTLTQKNVEAHQQQLASFEQSADFQSQQQQREKFKESMRGLAERFSTPTGDASATPEIVVEFAPPPSTDPHVAFLEDASTLAQLLDEQSLGTSPAAERWRDRAQRAQAYWSDDRVRAAAAGLKLSTKAAEVFGLPLVEADSFEASEIIRTANQLAREPLIVSDDINRLHVSMALNQATRFAEEGELFASSMMIENALAIRDFVKGFTVGIVQNLWDSVAGLWHVATHPVDSVVAISNAIINYEKTFDVIASKVKEVIEKFPTMTAEERGSLAGYLATEIFTSVATGGGSLAADAAKLAKAATVIKGVEMAVEHAATVLKAAPVLSRFEKAIDALSDIGKSNVEYLREYARKEGYVLKENLTGGPEVWGKTIDGEFAWFVKIKPEGSMRNGLEAGSQVPRASVRVDLEGTFINPFTGEVGKKSIGDHIPLEFDWTKK